MKIIKVSLVLFLLIFVSLSVYIFFGPFQLKNPSYLYWVYFGEECSKDYFENFIFEDPAKKRIITGLTEDKIRKRFPEIVDAENFPPNSYRRKILENYKNIDFKGKDIKMLWFDNEPERMGWVIVLVNGRGYSIDPVKG